MVLGDLFWSGIMMNLCPIHGVVIGELNYHSSDSGSSWKYPSATKVARIGRLFQRHATCAMRYIVGLVGTLVLRGYCGQALGHEVSDSDHDVSKSTLAGGSHLASAKSQQPPQQPPRNMVIIHELFMIFIIISIRFAN